MLKIVIVVMVHNEYYKKRSYKKRILSYNGLRVSEKSPLGQSPPPGEFPSGSGLGFGLGLG